MRSLDSNCCGRQCGQRIVGINIQKKFLARAGDIQYINNGSMKGAAVVGGILVVSPMLVKKD